MGKVTREYVKECIDRAEKLGMFFAQNNHRKDLYDVYDSSGTWVCYHLDLVKYFEMLDSRKNEHHI